MEKQDKEILAAGNNGGKKNKKIFILVILATIIGFSLFSLALIPFLAIYLRKGGIPSYQSNISKLPELQSYLAYVGAAKIMGDLAMTKKVAINASMAEVKKYTEKSSKALADLAVSDLLKDYQKAAVIWSIQIEAASQDTKTWKDLARQPGDFQLTLNDGQSKDLFQYSIKKIAELKKSGKDAIQSKDKDAMRLIAAKLLVQEHWLNGILHAKKGSLSFNFTPKAMAQVPEVGSGMDVTCQVCNDPSVRWTDQLRKQYNCDTRCNPSSKQAPSADANTQAQSNQDKNNSTGSLSNTSNNSPSSKAGEQAQFNYGSETRKICIGRGGTSTGNSGTNVFCVEEATQLANEIAASAIGFAEGEKISVDDWDKQFQEIDQIPLPEGLVGPEVSAPSAEGGHLEGGMGTISNGEPYQPPAPAPKPSPTKTITLPKTPPPPKIINPMDIDLDKESSSGQTGSKNRWK